MSAEAAWVALCAAIALALLGVLLLYGCSADGVSVRPGPPEARGYLDRREP